jgi:1-aminocyclopropane-1-carboxylate deaminase/D-cysteine desulfhydrase-like pyridoxal-dependent ACC family enzyme
MAGLLTLARSGRLGNEDTVVFIHTGGLPALFAYATEIMAPVD